MVAPPYNANEVELYPFTKKIQTPEHLRGNIKGDKMEGPVDRSQIRPFSIYTNSFPGRHSMTFLVFSLNDTKGQD